MAARSRLTLTLAGTLVLALSAGCSGLDTGSGEPHALARSSLPSLTGPSSYPLLENAPFRGRDSGPFELVEGGVCGPGLFEVRSHTNGTGTIVGAYSWNTLECFDGNSGLFSGSFTLTGANGDAIGGTYTGNITGFIDEVTATYDFSATVGGGTGRFEGASGSFSGAGQANLATGQQSQQFSGSLSIGHPGRG